MNQQRCPCVIPSPTEVEVGIIPGSTPGTAIRIRVEPDHDGYIRLEQLAYSDDLGWYTQKSFCVPADMVRPLIDQVRRAECLLPHAARTREPLTFAPAFEHDEANPVIGRLNA